VLLQWLMRLVSHLQGWLVEVINRTNHVTLRELGFPLRGRTRFPNPNARVIYPAVIARKYRKWRKDARVNDEDSSSLIGAVLGKLLRSDGIFAWRGASSTATVVEKLTPP
jgi:hypothetical protein